MLANSPGSPGLWESLTERAHDTPPRSSMLYCPMKILHTCLCVHVYHKAQLPQWQTVRDSQVSRSFTVGRGGGLGKINTVHGNESLSLLILPDLS